MERPSVVAAGLAVVAIAAAWQLGRADSPSGALALAAACAVAMGWLLRREEPEPEAEPEDFDVLLDKELARARRHEHPFVVLSAAPRRLSVPDAETALLAWLRGALHRYAEVRRSGDRLLALVPETRDLELPELMERLRSSAREALPAGLRLGAARFPTDAVASHELVARADRDRIEGSTGPRLTAVPGGGAEPEPAVPMRDAQPR